MSLRTTPIVALTATLVLPIAVDVQYVCVAFGPHRIFSADPDTPERHCPGYTALGFSLAGPPWRRPMIFTTRSLQKLHVIQHQVISLPTRKGFLNQLLRFLIDHGEIQSHCRDTAGRPRESARNLQSLPILLYICSKFQWSCQGLR